MYAPRRGVRKPIRSNHPHYGRSWATREEITEADEQDFISWIDDGLSNNGVGGARSRALQVGIASRASSRVDAASMQSRVCVHASVGPLVVEQGVLRCVKSLVDNVVYRARYHVQHGEGMLPIHFVKGKERHKHKTKVVAASSGSAASPHSSKGPKMTGRMRAARLRLTQRRSRGYVYRTEVLKRAATTRAEQDIEWLQTHCHRLATLIARQHMHELLPEGEL